MTPRERVLTALRHEEPDRVPLDLGGSTCRIAVGEPHGYLALCRHLGLGDVRVELRPASFNVSRVDERILRRFGVDLRHVRVRDLGRRVSDRVYEDMFGVRWLRMRSHYYPVDPPLKNARGPRDVEAYPWPRTDDPRLFEGLERRAEAYREEGYAVVAEIPGGIFHRYAFLRGFSRWFLDMRMEPELYRALADRITETLLEVSLNFLDAVGDYVDLAFFGDDMGHQTGPFLSVEDYRRYVKPWFSRYVGEVKKRFPRVKLIYHTCGSVYELIPEFIECGIDVLNPLQPNARNMNHRRIKREFGDRLCFHGGVDVQRVLPFGTVEEVARHVRKVIEDLAPGGGYILAPSQDIHPDVPPENIRAVYETALRYGRYPIRLSGS